MTGEISQSEISTAMEEMSRIWSQANIRFRLKGVNHLQGPVTPKQEKSLLVLENSDRSKEESNPALNRLRKNSIKRLTIGSFPEDLSSLNVYLLPYMGKTRQGNAMGRGLSVAVGMFSDKPSKGRLPPKRVLITESEPFKNGSLGRTIAHEIGHTFGLNHPSGGDFPDLMGGPNQGYTIRPGKINGARVKALNKFN